MLPAQPFKADTYIKGVAIIKIFTYVFTTALLIVISCGQSQVSDIKVIYDDDNRVESENAESEFKDIANSTVAMIHKKYIKKQLSNNKWAIDGPTLGNRDVYDFESKTGPYQYCADERFLKQTAIATCSGVLIAKDRILTAGHCISNESYCKNYAFVFDYEVDTSDGNKNSLLDPEDFYTCKQIIHSEDSSNGYDFAIIQTDRPVIGRNPMPIEMNDTIQKDTELMVVGHPLGLPLKLARDGEILRKEKNGFYYGALDTYHANSGSAIYDTSTKKIVGVLVSGDQDFVLDGICMRSKKCSKDSCNGEGFTPSKNVTQFIQYESRPYQKDTFLVSKSLEVTDQMIPDDFSSNTFKFEELQQNGLIDDLELTVKIEHSYPRDLIIAMESSSGQRFTIFNRDKGYSKDKPFELTIKMNTFWQLYRTSANGTWSLIVSDLGRGDEGKIIDASLKWRLIRQ